MTTSRKTNPLAREPSDEKERKIPRKERILRKILTWKRQKLLELCPRGNNKDVSIIILVHDKVYIPC